MVRSDLSGPRCSIGSSTLKPSAFNRLVPITGLPEGTTKISNKGIEPQLHFTGILTTPSMGIGNIVKVTKDYGHKIV